MGCMYGLMRPPSASTTSCTRSRNLRHKPSTSKLALMCWQMLRSRAAYSAGVSFHGRRGCETVSRRDSFRFLRTLFGLVRTSVLLHKNNKYNLEDDTCRATLLCKSKLKVEEMCTNTNIKRTISDSFGLLRTPFGLVQTRSGHHFYFTRTTKTQTHKVRRRLSSGLPFGLARTSFDRKTYIKL